MMKRNVLLTPGPATTTDTVKESLLVSDMWTRHPDFEKLMKSIRTDLLKIVNADNQYTCILFASSGTGVMEGMVTTLHPTQRALIISNGIYGERFCQIADIYGIDYYNLKLDWGEPIDIEKLNGLIESEMFSHIFMTHHETTTGILNPIKEVGKLAREYDLVFCVDAISSYAGVPINIKECGIDFLVGTSVKCLQGMSGIAFLICRRHRLEEIKKYQKSYYFNFYDQYTHLEDKNQSRFTVPVQIMYGLRQALDETLSEKDRMKRYEENYQTLVDGMNDKGFKSYLGKDVPRSKLLETFCFLDHPKFDFETFKNKLYKKGYTIYESLIPDTFRVCNIGAINSVDIASFLLVTDSVLRDMGIE